MSYDADNMSKFLGNDCTDEQAEQFAEYLISQGWKLSTYDDKYYAHRDGDEMTESEWADALAGYGRAARLTEIASDYIDEMCTNSPLERDDVLNTQRDLYRKNADHLSDCFADTREWAEDEDFTQAELEAEIVRQIMDGHAW